MNDDLQQEYLDLPQDTSLAIMERVPNGVFYLSKICHFNGLIKGMLKKLKDLGELIEGRMRWRQHRKQHLSETQMAQFGQLSKLINRNSTKVLTEFKNLDLTDQMEGLELQTLKSETLTEESGLMTQRYETLFERYINTQKKVLQYLEVHSIYEQKLLEVIV